MQRQFVRISATTAVVLAISTGGALLGADVATAASAPTLIASDCSSTIKGAPGEPTALSQSAVVSPVTNIVKGIPLLGPAAAQTVASTMDSMPALPTGSIPAGGSRTVSGSQIADQVVSEINRIPVIGIAASLVDSQVRSTLSGLCNMTLSVLPPPPPPPTQGSTQPSSQQPTHSTPPPSQGRTPSQSQQAGGQPGVGQPGAGALGVPSDLSGTSVPGAGGAYPGAEGGYPGSLATLPSFDFSQLPGTFTAPIVDYSALPGTGDAPGNGAGPGSGQSSPDSPSNVAGQAAVLAASNQQGIEMPVALAVLALGGVTAGLVRSWVLRRTSSS